MVYAVIKTGGKQYKVAENDVLRIEKIDAEVGNIFTLDNVLLVSDNDNVSVGNPVVAGASVAVEILAQKRARKVIIFKKRRRKSSQRKRGHRQSFTLIRISEILTNGATPSKPAIGIVRAEPAQSVEDASPVDTETKAGKAKKDDLKLLSGVGAVLVKKLNAAGLHTYQDIINLTTEQIAELDASLELGGRFEREEWQQQAAELQQGLPPRAKVDRKAQKDSE